MRTAVTFGILFALAGPAAGQKKEPPPAPRYGIEADLEAYPQGTPKVALASALRALDGRRYDYLAAQLGDPEGVDKRVRELGGKFETYVKAVTDRYTLDPEAVRELRRFASEGSINESGDAATVTHKDIKGRQVFLKKNGGRWFLEDRSTPSK